MRAVLILLGILVAITARPGWADRITDVVTWPDAPAVLKTGAQIRVEWSYLIEAPQGARIYARPMLGGRPAPGYSASGSELYRGQGVARAEFTLGAPGAIDGIRFQVIDEGQRIRHEQIVPMRFRFANDPLGGPASPPAIPGATTHAQPPELGTTLEMRSRDPLRPLVAADAMRGIQAGDLLVSPTPRLPDSIELPGGDLVTYQTVMGPPPPYDISANASDWARQVERWAGFMSVMMMFDIQRLLGDEAAFAEYLHKEEAETSNVFELMQYRRHAIGRLLDEL